MTCEKCGADMPDERADLGLVTCKDCTPQGKLYGFMAYDHKTGGTLAITENPEVFNASKVLSEREAEDL